MLHGGTLPRSHGAGLVPIADDAEPRDDGRSAARRVRPAACRFGVGELVLEFGDAVGMLESLPATGVTRLDVTSEFPVAPSQLARIKRATKRFTRLAWVSWPEV